MWASEYRHTLYLVNFRRLSFPMIPFCSNKKGEPFYETQLNKG